MLVFSSWSSLMDWKMEDLCFFLLVYSFENYNCSVYWLEGEALLMENLLLTPQSLTLISKMFLFS